MERASVPGVPARTCAGPILGGRAGGARDNPIAAKLARTANKTDPLLWTIGAAVCAVTAIVEASADDLAPALEAA